MQYTPNYNLNLPEGTDIVNPLVQDNPNWTAIDNAMYANKLRVIGTAAEVTSGTVHAITRVDTDIPVFRFVATSDYNVGDTFTVDGVSVTALLPDGTTPKNKAYVINATVVAVLDGTKLTFIGLEGYMDAADVDYDNSTSGLSATKVQTAVDELQSEIRTVNAVGLSGLSNVGLNYNNSKCIEKIIARIDISLTVNTSVSGWSTVGHVDKPPVDTAAIPLFNGINTDAKAYARILTDGSISVYNLTAGEIIVLGGSYIPQ